MLAFQAIKKSNMTLSGATGDVLSRSLNSLSDIIDQSLADIDLDSHTPRRGSYRR
jgi:hypothetical protein